MSEPVARLTAALGRRYVVERELGRGGMGTVYLARDLKHDRLVALKVLAADLAAALGPERFLREIAIAARLSHPHILPLHDSGHAAGLLYYVMPYIEGESLRDRLRRAAPLDVEEALGIAAEIADALDHAHRAGVVHRDVKPENILLASGHALLADFGVARALSGAGDQLTDSGLAVGTAGYASPEQAAGSREVDGRTDIYSLGCVLYEMLLGRPSDGRAAQELLARRFSEPLPAVRSLRLAVPEWVDPVLARAIALSADDRFGTAGEFRQALRDGRAPPHVTSHVPSVGRHQRLVWLGAGALAIAAIGAAVAFLPPLAPRTDPREVVVAGFENRTGDSSLAAVGDIATDYIARGLAATRLMHEVYDARATAAEADEPALRGAAAGRELAARVGAGTVLWGSYYRDGDSLHFEAQVVDAPSGRLIVSLEPAVGALGETTRIVELLRQRVMAGFAVVFGAGFESWKSASVPPTYEAYQEMVAGVQASWEFDNEGAARHFRRAAALDSTFTGAWSLAAYALAQQGQCAAVDSIARRLAPRGDLLPPVDRGWLDVARANCRGDLEGALAASRTVLASAPRSVGFSVYAAVMALELLRPKEALAILQRLDPERAGLSGRQLSVSLGWLGQAYHLSGDFRRELRTARGGSANALAGLGRVEEAERLAVGFLPAEYSEGELWSAEMAQCVALELRAHGHPEAGQRVLERVIAWLGSAETSSAATEDSFPCMWHHFSASYYAGRWDEARAAYEQRLAMDTSGLKPHAALGALAARRNDRTEVDRMDAWLRAREGDAAATQARARIAALLGDKASAVRLLRAAFDQGLNGRMYVHIDPDFESLHDYLPYRELVRPKG